jgi:hypothetical protein
MKRPEAKTGAIFRCPDPVYFGYRKAADIPKYGSSFKSL